MKSDSDILVLLKFYCIINYLPGLQKVKLCNNKLIEIDAFYKAYACFITLCICSYGTWSVYQNIFILLSKYSSCYSIVYIANLSSTVLVHILIIIHSNFLSPTPALNMYKSLMDIDDIFKYTEKEQRDSFFRKISLFFMIFIILKTVHILPTCSSLKNLYIIIFHVCLVVIDLEIFHFAIDINMISRRMERLNTRLIKSIKNVSALQDTGVDFELSTSILISLWKNVDDIKTKSIEEHIDDVNLNLDTYLCVFDKFKLAFQSLSSCYSLKILLIISSIFLGILSTVLSSIYLVNYIGISSVYVRNTMIWIIYQLIRLLVFTTSGEILCNQYEHINTIVGKLLIAIEHENEETLLLDRFLRQLEHTDFNLTAKCFFVVDYRFIFNMVGAFAAYIIVLTQLSN
ncbi:uncharacterized protein LOC143910346 [Arctopsyche grandis]|uniref:uncharacterized protein LOC143910346 n=1 Tax=Arctopsyche grandis TaxID=121162 RepID=UPI00406D91F3